MLSDIQIASAAKGLHISDIAKKLNIPDEYIYLYGSNKAKIDIKLLKKLESKPNGKLVLVSAINPTPYGEGKTTVSVGLADGLSRIGKKAVLALREPSLGPVFGVKGGAAGGGYAQVIPMEDINLHFTGDIHAVTAANNLLAAHIDNHIYHGNKLNIDPATISWRRCMDMNDRQLRNIIDGLGSSNGNGVPREDGFDISAASEIMAVLCLSENPNDLKTRLGNIVIGYTRSGEIVTVRDLKAEGALTLLLKDALNPNLVQTLEHTPAFIHGGPFANIAHGCNSIAATKLALKLSDVTVTEAGFGADLGAEKFIDIKCVAGGLRPDAVVIVCTTRALMAHGGAKKGERSVDILKRGLANLGKHIENIQGFGLPPVVAINRFSADTAEEIAAIYDYCKERNVPAEICEAWEKGGTGAEALARKVMEAAETPSSLTPAYTADMSIEAKIEAISKKIYGAATVEYGEGIRKEIRRLTQLGYSNLPICMAKTQFSLSDNKNKKGRPEGFAIHIKKIKLSAGAGFIVAFTGDIVTMPGLAEHPALVDMDIDENGNITGLF